MFNKKIIEITSYSFAFFWGILIILSLIGWGSFLNRLLFPKQQVDWGQKAAWGIAFTIMIGGILNLTWSISKAVIIIYLCLGLFYWLFAVYKERNLIANKLFNYIQECRKDKLLLGGSIVILLLILLRYSGSIAARYFNPHDDYQGYFIFPLRMLQIGSIGLDPFIGRKLSSLGGQSFLDTFVLSMLSEKNLNIIDSGVGLIVAVGVFWGLFKSECNLTNRQSIFLIFLFLVIRMGKVNITSVIIALALFVSLYRLLNFPKFKGENFLGYCCILAMVTSAIFALKSNLIIPCCLLLCLTYLLEIIDSRINKKIIYEFLCVIVLLVIFLLPWLISMYQSSGTFLYPFLGKGYEGSSYDANYLSPSSELTIIKAIEIVFKAVTSLDFLAFGLLSFVIVKQQRKQLISRKSPLPLILTTVCTIILLSLAVGGHNVGKDGLSQRYAVSFIVPAIMILMAIALENREKENLINPTQFKSVIVTMFVAGMLFVGLGDSKIIDNNFKSIKAALGGFDLVSQQEVSQYSKILQAIPPREAILTRLEKPFLLDFKRNRIFVVDGPGSSSLPPGMPFFKGSEALAEYLTSKSIRYVAYSYASEAGFSKESYQWMLDPERSSTWYRNDARYTFEFQDNLKNLGKTRKRIYDDGENFVIDLQSLEKNHFQYSHN